MLTMPQPYINPNQWWIHYCTEFKACQVVLLLSNAILNSSMTYENYTSALSKSGSNFFCSLNNTNASWF